METAQPAVYPPPQRDVVRPAGIVLDTVERRFAAFLATDGADHLMSGLWGLEREGLRIEPDGQPALTPHPFPPEEDAVTVDFAECQAELITAPQPSLEAAWTELATAQRRLQTAIGDELFWSLSLPGRWDRPERLVAAAFGGRPEWATARAYRAGLLERHGRARQAISGIHYNFSFAPEFFARWRAATGSRASEQDLRDDVYFAVMRNFLRHQHVFNALWGVSPPEDEFFWQDLLRGTAPETRAQAERCRDRISSIRLSPLGYGLGPDVAQAVGVTFASLEEYRERLGAALRPGPDGAALLAHEREFYSPVRPKPARAGADGENGEAAGASLDRLGQDGVGYLEFRVFDLDPFEPVGVSLEALQFFHVFVLAGLFRPSPPLTKTEREELTARWRWSTLCSSPLCECMRAPGGEAEIESLFATMSAVAAYLPAPYVEAVTAARGRWVGQPTRPIDRWRRERARAPGGALALGLRLAQEHRATLGV